VARQAAAAEIVIGDMTAPSTSFPFARAAAALGAYERNAREAARWAHPSWFAAALDLPAGASGASLDGLRGALATAHGACVAACSRALLRATNVNAPGFDTLRAPNLAVLDALPVEAGVRVLRMRALLLRRADVRKLIDKRSRQRLAQWVGVPLERLTASGAAGPANAPDVARLVSRGQLPALEEVDADTLAYEGYALLARDTPAAARPCPLLRLALPHALPDAAWLRASGRELDAAGTAQLVARLPELLPEWAWLFG
jgi:type III secretion system HrpB4-like protein